MTETPIELIPVDKIRIVNPRTRSKAVWLTIVGSIRSVGLKKPITVARRKQPDSEGRLFDLVCGQGRLEAFAELGEPDIPAIVSEASKDDHQLMSLAENIARRPPSNKSIYLEVKRLRESGYTSPAIARKLGLHRTHIHNIVRLVECGEAKLTEAVEAGRLPVSVAVEIATGSDESVQRALMEGYESGNIRGSQMRAIRCMMEKRAEDTRPLSKIEKKPLTGAALAGIFKARVKEQQRLVLKANETEQLLLAIASAMKVLLHDEDFLTLLRAEDLFDIPEQLATRIA